MGANKRLFEEERQILNNHYKNKNNMATGTTSDDSNRDVFYAKIKGLKKDHAGDPWIGLEQKKGNDYVEIKKVQWMSGWLSGAKTGSYEYEGKPVKTFELTLEDGIEKYVFQSSYNGLSRSLINSLLSTVNYGTLKISVYTSKKGYKSIGVELNGERLQWKYSIDEFKAKTKEIKDEEGEIIKISYKELDAWLEEEFKKNVIPNCKSNPNPYVAPVAEKATTTDSPSTTADSHQEEVKPLTGKEKIAKAKELKEELAKNSGAKSFTEDPSDDLPF